MSISVKLHTILAILVAVTLTSCAALHRNPVPVPPTLAQLSFQNGQVTTIKLNGENPALQAAFMQWAGQGVYTQTPVYRQLPGIFVLTGKPRLAGKGYVAGQSPSGNSIHPDEPPAESKAGDVGLVIHADGTVGPELILIYGHALLTCCEAPANVRIGKIVSGQSKLGSVQRGDNLTGIAIQ